MPHPEDLDVPDATPRVGFACPDPTTSCRLDELGLVVVGQRLEPDVRRSRVGSKRRTSGVDAAAVEEPRSAATGQAEGWGAGVPLGCGFRDSRRRDQSAPC